MVSIDLDWTCDGLLDSMAQAVTGFRYCIAHTRIPPWKLFLIRMIYSYTGKLWSPHGKVSIHILGINDIMTVRSIVAPEDVLYEDLIDNFLEDYNWTVAHEICHDVGEGRYFDKSHDDGKWPL